MGHVILAWGTSLMAVLIVMLVLYGIFSKKGDEQSHIWNAALVIFFPFVIVSLISLSMLYQIDGNYFMLLYSMLILGVCRAMVYFKKIGFYPLASKCLAPLLVLNLIVTAISSWAWTAGFSEIHLLNKGRVNAPGAGTGADGGKGKHADLAGSVAGSGKPGDRIWNASVLFAVSVQCGVV
ncbi:MAG: hypothetical protein ACLR8P_19425 [Clostridium fessum]